MEQDSFISKSKAWARSIKRDVIALWLAARDPRVPWHAKTIAALVAAYALSPIDLIPDFIPVLGYLDDLLIVPVGILIAVKLIPPDVMADLRLRATDQGRPKSTVGLIIVISIWIVSMALTIWWLWPQAAQWLANR